MSQLRLPVAEFLLATGYLVTAYVAIWVAREGAGFSAFWPPNALMLGCLIRVRSLNVTIAFIACAIAAVLGNLLLGDGLPTSLLLMSINMVEVGVSYILIRRVFRSAIDYTSVYDWTILMGLSAGIGCGIAATYGAFATQDMFSTPFWDLQPVWWLSDSIGMFLFLPAVLCFQRFDTTAVTRMRMVETAALMLVFLVLYELRKSYLSELSIIFFIPLIVWIAFRFGPFVTSVFNISLSSENLSALLSPVTDSISSGLTTDHVLGVKLGLIFMSCTTLALAISTQRSRQAESDLRASNTRLSETNADMHHLLHIVSHDLKSPLVTVQGFAGLLRHHLDYGSQEAQLKAIARIEDGTRVMSELIEDTLEFSMTDRSVVNASMLEFDQVLNEIVDVLEAQITESGATINLTTPGVLMNGDVAKVRQAVLNLVINALKHGCPDPGMNVDVTVQRHADFTRISVRDNGPGVDPRYHDRIFKLFSRVNGGDDGTGAGLAIVAKIASQHGGAAGVTSEPGQGAEFWITLRA